MSIILGFKLKYHTRFLSRLTKAFRNLDPNNSGFIPRKKVSQLILKLDKKRQLPRKEVDNLLERIPFDLINYSDLVAILVKHWIKVGNEELTFLKIICQN